MDPPGVMDRIKLIFGKLTIQGCLGKLKDEVFSLPHLIKHPGMQGNVVVNTDNDDVIFYHVIQYCRVLLSSRRKRGAFVPSLSVQFVVLYVMVARR